MSSNSITVEAPTQGRTVPMKVLALGFPRTGTASLQMALETLGYVRTNHGFTVIASSPATMAMWAAAIRAKFYGVGKPYGRAEWDILLGDCMAVTDAPHILFAQELVAAYPEAKVILTTRSPESWWNSYQTTIAQSLPHTVQTRLGAWLNPAAAEATPHGLGRLIFGPILFGVGVEQVTKEIAKARFKAHYDEVRRLVPKDRLLEFEMKEGWAPLVDFLGMEAPPTAFPRINDVGQYRQTMSGYRDGVLVMCVSKSVVPLLTVGAAVSILVVYLCNA